MRACPIRFILVTLCLALAAVPKPSFAGASVDITSFWEMYPDYGLPDGVSFVQFGGSGFTNLSDSINYGAKTDIVNNNGGYYLTNSDPANTGDIVLFSTSGAAGNPFTLYVSNGTYDVASYSAQVVGFFLGDTHLCSTDGPRDENCTEYPSPPPSITLTDILDDTTGEDGLGVAIPAPGDVVEFDFTSHIVATMVVPEPISWPVWLAGVGLAGVLSRRRRQPIAG